MVNRTSNMDSRLSELFCLSERLDLELAKGVQIIEVGLYLFLLKIWHENNNIA